MRPPTRLEVVELARNFRQRSQRRDVSVEEATEWLSKARKHCELYSRNQKETTCRELNLGVTTLEWYQGTYPSHAREKAVSTEFLDGLCWHLIVQGREDLLWNWIKNIGDEITRTLPPEEANAYPEAYKWTIRLLGTFVNAQIETAPQQNPTVAIKTVFKLLHLLGKGGKYHKYMPLPNAGLAINRRIRTADCPPIDAELFDRFCQTADAFISRGVIEHMAKLKLFHPSRPDASEFYRLVNEDFGALSESFYDTIREQAKRGHAIVYLRAAYILRHQGRESEAQHLEDIVERKCPAVYKVRERVERELERDMRLNNVRKEAVLERNASSAPAA